MFSIAHTQINGFDTIVLTDEKAGTNVSVVPSCGAMLLAFEVLHHDKLLNIVDQYNDMADYQHNQATKGFKSAKLSPFVCRLSKGNYQFEEADYTIEKFYLGDHALHGLLYDAEFLLVAESANEEKASVQMEYAYTGEDNGYPFCYDCIVIYELTDENYLTISTTIINKSQSPIPISDGWHPYFTFGNSINELQLEFQSKAQLQFNEQMIATGKIELYDDFNALRKIETRQFDDCFMLNFAECQPMVVLRDKEKKLQLEIYPDKNYPYLQLYTPGERTSIAIENLSAAPDAFNNGMGLTILEAGAATSFKTAYKITHLTT